MKIRVSKDNFAIAKLKRIEKIPRSAFVVIFDRGEITLVAKESEVEKLECEGIEKSFRLITFDMLLPFDLVGFLAKIFQALAEEGISVFAISSYSTDHILIKEKDLKKSLEVLKKLGFKVVEN